MPFDKDTKKKLEDYLFEAILTLKTKEECRDFFDDLCTIKELEEMAKRMCGAKMLNENMVYTDISDKTGLSTATISRINRCLRYGSDGYNRVLDRLEEKGIVPEVDFVTGEKKNDE